LLALDFAGIGDSQQFDESILEEEAAVLGALARVMVAGAFGQSQAGQQLGLGSAGAGADKDMVYLHGSHYTWSPDFSRMMALISST
jgi:hypothetical protein